MNLKSMTGVALAALFSITAAGALHAEAASDEELGKQVGKILQSFGITDAEARISKIDVNGLREVVVGNDVFYLTEDGKHFLVGNLLAVDGGMTNLTEKSKGRLRNEAISTLSDEEMIIFGDAESKHTLTVFTDVNCGFCSRFHQKMDDFNKAGVRVKYIFMPVIQKTSYDDAKNVWCAEDRNIAITEAKAGKKLPKGSCETPIDKHLQIGRDLNINSTPTILLSDGTKFNGNWMQMTGTQLAAYLDLVDK